MSVLIKPADMLRLPDRLPVDLYSTLRYTAFSRLIPYLTIQVEDWVMQATEIYFRHGGYAGFQLETYLRMIKEQ